MITYWWADPSKGKVPTDDHQHSCGTVIGAVLGDSDSENTTWKRAINALSKQVQSARQSVENPLRVNVVYDVDGKLARDEFEGVRTGIFRKSDRHLLVQAGRTCGSSWRIYEPSCCSS